MVDKYRRRNTNHDGRSPKVLHVISRFAAGGAEIFVRDLAISLQSRGVRQSICAVKRATPNGPDAKYEEDFKSRLRDKGIACEVLGAQPVQNWLLMKTRFLKTVQHEMPDIIHCHLTTGVVLSFLGRVDCPVIYTHHNTPVRARYLHLLVFRFYLTAYIAISQSSRSALIAQARVSPRKISLVRNGICTYASPKNPQAVGFSATRILITVARLGPQKNISLLIEAMADVVKQCLHDGMKCPILRIVGDGPERNSLERRVDELGLTNYVEFLGLRNDVPALLSSADIYVMSSRWEGLSIALLEAQASGLPIIATNVGGNPEIVVHGETGFVVPPNDASAISRSVMFLLSNETERRTMSVNAIRRAENFSLDESANRHAKLYTDIVGAGTA